MDTFSRLILACFAWACLWAPGSVLAAGAVTGGTTQTCNWIGTSSTVNFVDYCAGQTAQAACTHFQGLYGFGGTMVSWGSPCERNGQPGNAYQSGTNHTYTTGCPTNATGSGGTCTCNANYVPNLAGTACVAASIECPDRTFGITALQVPSVGLGACYENCAVRGTSSYATGGTVWVYGPWTMDSPGDCASSTASDIPTENVCPVGQVRATVGGSSVCVPATTSVTGQQSTATAPAGAASAPTQTVSDGQGGSIGVPPGGTSTSETTCTGTQCITTTTVKNASGVTVGTVTGTGTKESFCTQNPDTTICKASSFSGACITAFACEGDAVQCAIAKDQHLRHCQLMDTPNTESIAGEAFLDRSATPTKITGAVGTPGNPLEVDIGAQFTTLPSNPFASSCPSDQTVAGVVIPLSQACTSLQLLGYALVAFTVLSCAAWLVNRGV